MHSHGSQRNAQCVPVFPLPNVFLFPDGIMPLHIFESRYRQMIDDLLDRPGRLVIATPAEEEADFTSKPRLFEIGGLGEIGRHERLADGRYLIWLVGIKRVKIEEVPSDRMYRKVAIHPFAESPVDHAREPALRMAVQRALLDRCPEFLNVPHDVPLANLVDRLLQRIPMPQSTMQALYAEPDLTARTEAALREHARRSPPVKGSQN